MGLGKMPESPASPRGPRLDTEEVLRQLGDVSASEGYDAAATLVVANLPKHATTLSVGSFFSWFAPVVHVEELERTLPAAPSSLCFTVTFVDLAAAQSVLDCNVTPFAEDGKSTN